MSTTQKTLADYMNDLYQLFNVTPKSPLKRQAPVSFSEECIIDENVASDNQFVALQILNQMGIHGNLRDCVTADILAF